MSETPERIQREMFEIRSRMSSDVVDLRKHLDPQVLKEHARQTARERLQRLVNRYKARLKEKQRAFGDSAVFQLSLARKTAETRDPAPLADAVRSDPKPLAVLAVLLAVSLSLVARAARRKEQ